MTAMVIAVLLQVVYDLSVNIAAALIVRIVFG